MVRDAQRSARDTELLVTLVRAATEMRNNFEDLKRLLADTEDVIITEVKENTEKTVQRAIGGPRPYPGSSRNSQAGTINDDINAKKRSIFRRALKGLTSKSANDLTRIEEMLMQLLNEVDALKAQTAGGNMQSSMAPSNLDMQSYQALQPEGQYEQDQGYEPEGHAGTSTTSHPSQSGHFSVQSRASGRPGYDRKPSAYRISTVPEDNEDEYDHGGRADDMNIMTPPQNQPANAAPLNTSPAAQGTNDNTPKTEESGKKTKSGRSSWFRLPKISRWSETTTSSSVPESSRHSKQPSRDESVNNASAPPQSEPYQYEDNYQFSQPQTFQSDKLHTGFSEQDLTHGGLHEEPQPDPATVFDQIPSPPPESNWMTHSMTPENPKYRAHRDSLNLQHPQPRPGQTERFKAALESQALGFDVGSPMSPKSADWGASTTSLPRFPAAPESYGSVSPGLGEHYHWTSSSPLPAANLSAPPPRPPKEPLDYQDPNAMAPPASPGGLSQIRGTPVQMPPMSDSRSSTPAQHKRVTALQGKQTGGSYSVESGYGTMTSGSAPAAGSVTTSGSSPKLENRNLSNALQSSAVNRRPSGPRPMTPSGREERRRERGLFSP